ncbi:hypothetical protein LCGC14_1294510 [marine sediment metagenome]|uniref:Uncharacterized protein n=1 Tax=marine sediment metagenome TaxID=412755 RepID=A0A0F9N801_9ZZZZ
MAKSSAQPERISVKLKTDLLSAGEDRVKKGLMKAIELRMPKMTELMTRTISYPKLLEELRTKPEKKKDG